MKKTLVMAISLFVCLTHTAGLGFAMYGGSSEVLITKNCKLKTVSYTANYGPHGEDWGSEGFNPTPFTWLGGYGVMTLETDTPLRLYLTRHRVYSATLNRFLSADPLGLAGGLNLYMYGEGNPVAYMDPLGLCPTSTGKSSVVFDIFGALMPVHSAVLRNDDGYIGGSLVSHLQYANERNETVTGLEYIAGGLAVTTYGAAAAGYGIASGVSALAPLAPVAAQTAQSVDPNKLHHIFDKAGRGLDAMVNQYGSQQAAFNAIQKATEVAVRGQNITGEFYTKPLLVKIGEMSVTVRGNVVNGVVK
ncbi:MAG: RHS repeat-associated core domain-containing protein [Kiritimatiellaeota bacterium]|nr:RHS repeat-associated core domain-containing protein [Kiritimatiellota bacterium]